MQRKNVNPFKNHFLYFLSLRSFSMSLLSCERVGKREIQMKRGRDGDNESYIWFNCFVFNHCCLFVCVYVCTLTIWPLWAARFAPAGWIGRHLSLLFCVCVCCFFQSSTLWNFGIHSRFRQRFRREFFSHLFFVLLFIVHIQSPNENREQLILFSPKSIFIFKRLQSTVAFL